ncbi:MAG: leucine-rich repeat domain-containing protein [Oscillospiraceae bacterium]|nr:leucine-rich repeat domain-containing protein [Oscillospiraceae bacterium]
MTSVKIKQDVLAQHRAGVSNRKIEKGAFNFCLDLRDVTLPKNLSSIGYLQMTH